MNSLAFLILRGAKNRFLELLRKPGKLALYIVVILVLGGVITINALTGSHGESVLDIAYLKGILFAFFLLFFFTAIKSGLSQGSTLFGMDDVNLLFVSPVNPRSILLYGVLSVVKTMALASVFIFFQGGSLRAFGVDTGGLAILYAGYLLTTVVTQLLGLFIYSATNGRPKRQRLVKILVMLMFAPLIAFAAYRVLAAGADYMEALRSILASPYLTFTPILGWAAAGIAAFITGEAAMGALFFGLLLLSGVVFVAIIYIGKPDYYEDVLVASETAFEQKRNLAEGKVNALEQNAKRSIRVKGTGVGGQGASAFLYKHLRESFRANRFGLWGIPTLLMVVGAAAFMFFMRSVMEADESSVAMLIMLATLMWMQIFFIGTGRGLKETYSHYIYLIPESPFKKMVWSNTEIMIKALVEGILICAVSGVAAGADLLTILFCAAAYTLFIFMLIAVNYVFMRFTGADLSAGLLVMFYTFAVLFLMLPGIVLAIVLGATALGIPGALAVLALWELAVALVCFWTSKGILHDCDMAVMRQAGK